LDIYIYFVQNYQNVLVKHISSISTLKGTMPVFVDDTWRLDSSAQTYESLIYIVPNGVNPERELGNPYSDYPTPIHNYVERTLLMYIYSAYIYFNHTKLTRVLFIELALVPISTSSVTSISSTTTASIQTITSSRNNTQPTTTIAAYSRPSLLPTDQLNKELRNTSSIELWIIAVVVLACLAVLGACLAIFWVMRHNRRRKLVYGEKGHLGKREIYRLNVA
jgi:hypothetical protein